MMRDSALRQKCRELLLQMMRLSSQDWENQVPADHISRNAWQRTAEKLVEHVRTVGEMPGFTLSEPEISIHYHRSLRDLVELIKDRSVGGRMQ